jgi:23S rRNA pseudouridine1911/1915/1917 synthase
VSDPRRFAVGPEAAGERLDTWLAALLEETSRSAVARAITEGRLTVDGASPRKAGQRLKGGEAVALWPDLGADPERPQAQDIAIHVVYEDEHLAVVDKPAGLVVHPAAGHADGTLVNALLHHFEALGGGAARPGIVHRLDRDTSGLLVVAKDDATLAALQEQFRARTIERRYLAVVLGARIEDAGTLDTWYGRHPTQRKQMTGRLAQGRRAVTHWTVLRRSLAQALLMVRLDTGRTHQIRVHLAEAGHPVVGDPLYGRQPPAMGGHGAGELAAARRMTRQALHAASLGLAHPADGRWLRFTSRPPRDLDVLIRRAFGEDAVDEAMARVAGAGAP